MIKTSPWAVCLTATLFFLYEFIQMNMFNALSVSVIQTFSISPLQLGLISASYGYGNLIGLFPAGLLLDRLDTKKIILTSMAISVIGTFIFASSNSVLIAGLGHFISGIAGGSFCFLSAMKLASRWFPPQRMALITGIIVTLAMCGGIIAQTPLILLIHGIGWRNAIFMLGGLGILILGLIFIFVKSTPPDQKGKDTNRIIENDFWHSIKLSISNKQNWLGGAYTSLLNLSIIVLGALWGNLYLMQAHNITQLQASFVSSMLFVGILLGSPIAGLASDWIGRRRSPMMVSALITLIIILLILYCHNLSWQVLAGLFLALGFSASAQSIGYPLIVESNSSGSVGGALGLAAAIVIGGGAVFQPVFGWLVQSYDYHFAVLIFPIAAVLSLLAAFFSKETYCKAIK